MTNAKRRRLWRDRVAQYRSSELSVREWCERNGVTENALRYWLKRIDVEAEAVEWAAVEIVEGCSKASSIEIYIGPARIQARSGFDAKLLGEVLRVVVASC